jgi:UDPglucose--hexose-1-phosphate uridylyltransferase
MVTTEVRTDPITGRSVVVDLGPFKRRDDFELGPVRIEDPPSACPLCEGREADAGPEILAWREGGPANLPGWSVRVVPNGHPMLRIEGGTALRSQGLFEVRDGLGAHEVIVETPIHDQPLHTLDVDRLWRVLWAWRTRIQDLKRDSRFVSVVIFKNHGKAAGARLDHAHSQLTAFPFVPPALGDKLRGSALHLSKTGRCIYCDLIAEELKDGRRIISDHDSVLAIAPYASRVPFETWLIPRAHAARFEDAADATLEAVAGTLKTVMARIDWALERPACNLVLHTAPLSGEADAAFHWHLEILPRVTRYSGLEWGSGVHRNPVSPEEAATVLRSPRGQVQL